MNFLPKKSNVRWFLAFIPVFLFSLMFVPFQSIKAAPNCRLITTFNASKTQVALNEPVTYTLTITNTSKRICTRVSVSVYYPENIQILALAPKATASNYYWELGSIISNQTKRITITAAHLQEGSVQLETCATARNSADACSSISMGASRAVLQTPSDPPSAPPPGREIPNTNPASLEYGSWIWDSPVAMSEQTMTDLIATAAAQRINVLYVTIDDYLEIAALPAGTLKESRKKIYVDALTRMLELAQAKGVAIDAEAGWRDWVLEEQKNKAWTLIDFVTNYNATHTVKLRGFQYDVEPYLLPHYEAEKAKVLTQFVQFIDESVIRLQNTDIRFSIAIPHFYDSTQAWTPSVVYQGVTAHTFTHLLRLMDRRAGSTILIMAYRNTSVGDNGTIQISQSEIDEAAGHPTRVIVAQEFGNVDPSFVTFYGKSRAYYDSEEKKIRDAFAESSGYGGIALHYLQPFLALK